MWERIRANLKVTYDIFFAAGREFGADRVGRMAAAVAYRAMFATAPLFLLAVWVAGLVLGDREAETEILTRVREFAGSDVEAALETFIDSVQVSGNTAAVLGVALLVWTASSLFIAIQTDLNDIFHVPQESIVGFMGFVKKRVLGFLWVFAVGIAVIAVWLLNAVWRFVGDRILPPDAESLHFVIGLIALLLSLVLLPAIFGVFIQTMTAVRVRWRAVWLGSFFTSVAFLTAAYGIGLYFAWDRDTSAPQVAASIFVILLLAFVLSTVFYFGAEVTKVYDDYLELGDVKTPQERAAEPRFPEVVVSEPDRSLPLAAFFAFLGGLFVGWWKRR
jgi:membrane protein